MRILKKDATEVRKGIECGIGLEGFQAYQEGDIIQFIEYKESPGVL